MWPVQRSRGRPRPSFQPRLEVLEDRLLLATRIWDGGGSTSNWSDRFNWSGNVAPNIGDDLIFPEIAFRKANTNDFANGRNFTSLTFEGSGYTLSGNRIDLRRNGEGITASNASGTNTVNFDINLGAPLLFEERLFEVTADRATLVLNGKISGGTNARLQLRGDGEFVLAGANDYSGLTFVAGRYTVTLRNGSGLGRPSSGTGFSTTAAGVLRLEGGITVPEPMEVPGLGFSSHAVQSVSGINALTGPLLLGKTLFIGINFESQLTISGKLSDDRFGVGALNISGTRLGTLILSGPNDYSGETVFAAVTLVVGNSTALGQATAGTSAVAGGTLAVRSAVNVAEPVTLRGGAMRSLSPALFSQAYTATWSGPITLAGLVNRLTADAGTFLRLTGGLSGEGDVAADGAGTLELAGDELFSYTGNLQSSVNTLLVNAALQNTGTTLLSGTLSGTGSLTELVAQAGTVTPGASLVSTTGILTVTGNAAFGPSSLLRFDLRGTTPGTSHDQLRVDDLVNLGGPQLGVALGFDSAVDDTFTLIDNAGTDAIIGTFAGLPVDGSTFTVNGPDGQPVLFEINYRGGTDADDVVIRHLNTPSMAPELAVSPAVLNEGGVVTLTGRLSDPDLLDRLTLTVHWGDGSVETFRPGRDPFALTHRYRDDPSGTERYVIRVAWSDQHGGGNSRELAVEVRNIAPTVQAGGEAALRFGRLLVRHGSFADPGADAWSAKVDYGDGTGAQPLRLGPNGQFVLRHHYEQPGTYTVTVTVTDDDGGVGTATFLVEVPPPRELADALFALLGQEGSESEWGI